MTNKEILEQVIKKAVKNGYDGNQLIVQGDYKVIVEQAAQIFYERLWIDCGKWFSVEEFIFSHHFAKAFWGTKEQGQGVNRRTIDTHYHTGFGKSKEISYWEWNLANLAIVKDRLEYLSRFL